MRIPTYVYGEDAVIEAGVAAHLRRCPNVEVVSEDRVDDAQVAVVAVDAPDEDALRVVRALQRSDGLHVVLLVGRCDEDDVLAAVEAGVYGLVRRSEATQDRLERAVTAAAAGGGSLPADVLGRFMRQVGRLRDRADDRFDRLTCLDDREVAVLKLVADGLDTRQIADQLAYSERTIKGIIQEVTRRFGLRNRSHAVAYAFRQGLI